MKRPFIIIILSLFISGIMFVCCTSFELGQDTQTTSMLHGVVTKSNGEYDYSKVKPYWLQKDSLVRAVKYIESGAEKIKACQIDSVELASMSMEELVESCYSFPLAFEIVLCNDEIAAVEFYIEHFNGLKELSQREYGAKALIDLYSSIIPQSIEQQYREAYLERLLLSKHFFSNMTFKDAQRLAGIVTEKQGYRSRQTNDLIGQQRIASLEAALTHTSPFIQGLFTDSYYGGSYTTETVYTPFQQSVTAYIYDDTIPWYARDFNEQYILDFYPYVTIVSVDSTVYNSHAYALKGSKYYTIENASDVMKFFTNDLYIACAESAAKIIHYYAGDHTAERYNSSHYISKWYEALVIHGPNQVPPAFQPSYKSYYTEPQISGPDYLEIGETYYYTVSPYMSYATYDWFIDQNDERYQIISINDNVLQVKFLVNAIFDVYCTVCNSSGYPARTLMYETLY